MFAKLQRSMQPGLFVVLLATCLQGHAESANTVYAQVSRSVGIVLVSTFEGQLVGSGSAVTVAPQTMVTNRHVLLSGHRYQVYVGGYILDAEAGICDSTQDLCLLSIPKLEARPVEFADASTFSVGDVVYTIGAPNEISNIVGVSQATNQKSYSPPQLSLSNGLITALRPVEDGKIIQTNAAISPGSSGGGLFDTSGRLVGITTFAMRNGQGLNMALPVNWVARLGVSGSPRISEAAAQVQMPASPSFSRDPAPVTETESVPQEIETSVAAPGQNKNSGPAEAGSMTRYAWGAIPLGLLAIWLLRRRRQDDDDDFATPIMPPPPEALQRFMTEAEQELDQNRPNLTLWNLMIADNKGNMEAARRSYIERRAARLLSEEKDKQWAAAAQQNPTH